MGGAADPSHATWRPAWVGVGAPAEGESRKFYEQEMALIKAEEPFWAIEERETRMLMRFEEMQRKEDEAVKLAVARADEDAIFVLGTDMMKSILKQEARAEVSSHGLSAHVEI